MPWFSRGLRAALSLSLSMKVASTMWEFGSAGAMGLAVARAREIRRMVNSFIFAVIWDPVLSFVGSYRCAGRLPTILGQLSLSGRQTKGTKVTWKSA